MQVRPDVITFVQSPLTPEMLPGVAGRSLRLVLKRPIAKEDFPAIHTYANQFGEVDVCVANRSGIADLDLLDGLTTVTGFDLLDFGFSAFSEFSRLPITIRKLRVSATASSKLNLKFLERFTHLQDLEIEKQPKGIESISTLGSLSSLTLRSISLLSLDFLRPLAGLLSLDLKLGSLRNFECIAEIGKLRYLELWMIRGLNDLGPVAEMPHLQFLFLETLSSIERLPSFRQLGCLRRVRLQKLKSLSDLSPVSDAPRIEDLIVGYMGHLEPSSFSVFCGHPTLKRASIGLGSTSKNIAVERLLGLPPVTPEFEFR